MVVLAGNVVAVDRYRPYGIDLAHPLGTRHPASSPTHAVATTATVTRQTLSARTTVDGTLGYAASSTSSTRPAASSPHCPPPARSSNGARSSTGSTGNP